MLDVVLIDDGGGTRDDGAVLARDESLDVAPRAIRRLTRQDVKLEALRSGPSRGTILIDAIVKAHEFGQCFSSAGISI